MAAFSSPSSFHHHHHHQPSFLLDSLFLPNSTIDETSHPPKNLQPTTFIHQNHSMDNSSSIVTDQKHDENSSEHLTDQNLITPMEKKRKCKQASSANSAQSKDKREVLRGKKQKKVIKEDEEKKKKKKNSNSKENNKGAEEKGFIHVRARRGQATDSHSLAERVRRERISERMKLLQTLVPGCDKVTGKALMLDEIINYVQSLQNQVEFLSMKLASVNPMFYDFGVDLESFMVRPDQYIICMQDLSELPSPMPSMQECSPTISANNNNINYNNFVVENSANHNLLFQQSQAPTTLLPHHPQGSRQGLWEVDELRQKILNQSGFNNSLFSFH